MTAVLEKNEVKELWCWKSDLLIKAFKLRLDSKYSHKGAPIWRNDPEIVKFHEQRVAAYRFGA
jgi:hypothetical protein